MRSALADASEAMFVGGFVAFFFAFALILWVDACSAHGEPRSALIRRTGLPEGTSVAQAEPNDYVPASFVVGGSEAEARVVTFPKEGNGTSENEDAGTLRAEMAAVGDGASSSFDSGRWATFLCQSVVEEWPEPGPEAFRRWLLECARRYRRGGRVPEATEVAGDEKGIDWLDSATEGLPACAALVAVRLQMSDDESLTWQGLSIGDSVAVQLRFLNDTWRMVSGFPVERSAAIDGTPELSCSTASSLDQIPSVRLGSGPALPGDVWLLMTDECARWALGRAEVGEPLWSLLIDQDPAEIEAAASAARRVGAIANDDMTVACLRSITTTDMEPFEGVGGGT